jgi:hypothetical protein
VAYVALVTPQIVIQGGLRCFSGAKSVIQGG